MVTNDSANVAVIGCGYWGKNLVRNFAQLGALRMVCDATEVGRQRATELAPDCATVADPAEVWEAPVAGAVIATPPRSQIVRRHLYERTLVRRGATIGANATIVCGVTIGRYAFVGAGVVVCHDVPDYALMLGVPARQKGWMSRHGHRLHNPSDDGIMVCPESGWRYREVEPGALRCLDWAEDEALPMTNAQ